MTKQQCIENFILFHLNDSIWNYMGFSDSDKWLFFLETNDGDRFVMSMMFETTILKFFGATVENYWDDDFFSRIREWTENNQKLLNDKRLGS